MSKQAKLKARELRRKQKAARKSANYLRFGPKQGHVGKRQKQKALSSQFRPGAPKGEIKLSQPKGDPSKHTRPAGSSGRKRFAKFPLRPLRKRLHLGAKEIGNKRRGL